MLQMRMLKTKMCRWAQQGKCERGETCFFAHSKEELRRCPDLSMTRMCANFEHNGSCANGRNCKFAHCEAELRGTVDFYRTAICEDWKKGACKLDGFCRFAHGNSQLNHKPPIEEIESDTRAEAEAQRGSASPATTASTPDSSPLFFDDKSAKLSPLELLAAALAQAELPAELTPRLENSPPDCSLTGAQNVEESLRFDSEAPSNFLHQLVASLTDEEVNSLRRSA